MTLREARERASFPILTPMFPALADPDAVYRGRSAPAGHVTLVYGARPGLPAAAETGVGLLFTQIHGTVDPGMFRKALPQATLLEAVTVNGGPGYWIVGQPHVFFYKEHQGGSKRSGCGSPGIRSCGSRAASRSALRGRRGPGRGARHRRLRPLTSREPIGPDSCL